MGFKGLLVKIIDECFHRQLDPVAYATVNAHILVASVIYCFNSYSLTVSRMQSAHWRAFFNDSVSKSGKKNFAGKISGFLHFSMSSFANF